jgi:hypothetical protein
VGIFCSAPGLPIIVIDHIHRANRPSLVTIGLYAHRRGRKLHPWPKLALQPTGLGFVIIHAAQYAIARTDNFTM